METIKIQLNSLEALERLISNDAQLEFEIKNSVVQSFVTKHLKGIANESMVQNAEREVQKIVKEFFNTGYSYVVLKKEQKEAIESHVRDEIMRHAISIIDSELGIESIRTNLHKRVEAVSTIISEELKEAVIQERVNAMVTKKLKELIEKQ